MPARSAAVIAGVAAMVGYRYGPMTERDHGQDRLALPPARVRLPVLGDLRRPRLDLRLRPLRRADEEPHPLALAAGDGAGARRHRRDRLGGDPQPVGLGGVGPRRRLQRPARRLPHVQAPLPRRPARGRAMRQEAVEAPGRVLRVRPHRAAPVQPDVPDAGRRDGGRIARPPTSARRPRRASSSTSRTCCSSRGASRRSASRRSASRSATRSRPATSSSACASSSRWRWSSSSRRPRPSSGTATGSSSASAGTLDLGLRESMLRVREHDADGALALLERDERHRVPLSDRLAGARGRREPRRLRPDAAHAGIGHEARVRRPGGRALHAVRDRARRVDRADLRRDALRRVRRGGRRRARADGAAPAPGRSRR